MATGTAETKTWWERWGKDVLIAAIAAMAVWGGVVTSCQSTTKTLAAQNESTTMTIDAQRAQADREYLSGLKQEVFTDVLQKNVTMGRAIDQLVQDAEPVRLGKSPRIPDGTLEQLKKTRDDLGYAVQPLLIVAQDTVDEANAVIQTATSMWSTAYDVNQLADTKPVNPKAVQAKAAELVNSIVVDKKMPDLIWKMTDAMSHDLGLQAR